MGSVDPLLVGAAASLLAVGETALVYAVTGWAAFYLGRTLVRIFRPARRRVSSATGRDRPRSGGCAGCDGCH